REETNQKLTMQRIIFGIHLPLRHIIEQSIVFKMRCLPPLPSSNFGLEILMDKDEPIDFEDFLNLLVVLTTNTPGTGSGSCNVTA
ncbi:19485_t:CDS:2, partial [Racocetra persica]